MSGEAIRRGGGQELNAVFMVFVIRRQIGRERESRIEWKSYRHKVSAVFPLLRVCVARFCDYDDDDYEKESSNGRSINAV